VIVIGASFKIVPPCQCVEDWAMHAALISDSPTLTLPIGRNGAQQLEKIPLAVKSARVAMAGTVPPKP
jgi:hypothetical protein